MNELGKAVAAEFFPGSVIEPEIYQLAKRFLVSLHGGDIEDPSYPEDLDAKAGKAFGLDANDTGYYVWKARYEAYKDPERYRKWHVLDRMGI